MASAIFAGDTLPCHDIADGCRASSAAEGLERPRVSHNHENTSVERHNKNDNIRHKRHNTRLLLFLCVVFVVFVTIALA